MVELDRRVALGNSALADQIGLAFDRSVGLAAASCAPVPVSAESRTPEADHQTCLQVADPSVVPAVNLDLGTL